MVARLCRFKSCCPHQKKTIRKGCLFSCGSGLETKLRFVGKRHCVCLPLHAADAPLGNNIALLMLLRSLRSLQVLLSAPKQTKTNRIISVRFFISWFATGLVTMQGIVCTLRVTCTLCSWRNALQVNLLAYAITLAPLSTSPVVCVANYKVQKIYKMRKKLYNKKRYNMLCMKTGKVTNEKNRERIRN